MSRDDSANGGEALRAALNPRIESDEWTFTVDSALLRELGERLVGKPHVALAELVKNSYDADAAHVDIFFESESSETTKGSVELRNGSIQVLDNGIGMDRDDFKRFWMRVGSAHKQEQRTSLEKGRPLTGSKGVGRFAVQFLARKIKIVTSKKGWGRELEVSVDWDEAVQAGTLTEAKAQWIERPSTIKFARGETHGTWIELHGLNKEVWTDDDFKSLAKEIWWLQPPLVDPRKDTSDAFTVELTTPVEGLVEEFDRQMGAYIDLWYAEIRGHLRPQREDEDPVRDRIVDISLEFEDGVRVAFEHPVEDCHIDRLDFEIRTYYLAGRQKYGIKVGEAREYFNDNGGVYVYDAGFRLPFYGGKESDWLGLEYDHAHRLSRSKLLPEHLQIEGGMTYLPTNSRVLGVVRIDTSHERSVFSPPRKGAPDKREGTAQNDEKEGETGTSLERRTEHLEVQVTRDRLVESQASKQLRDVVRAALDFYAVTEARRAFQKKEEQKPTESPSEQVEEILEVVERHRADIPEPVYMSLRGGLEKAAKAAEAEKEAFDSRLALMAPLATAGMAALAHEHEAAKQFHLLRAIVKRLDRLDAGSALSREIDEIRASLDDWIERSEKTRRLFTHLLDEENRQSEHRLRAKAVLRDVQRQTEILLRGVEVDLSDVDADLRLPHGSHAEWSALFQNVLINAMNAMLDQERRLVHISSHADAKRRTIRLEDTGVGVDIAESDRLFEPFVRALEISRERRMLGLGGSGVGLTIVRMIAENRGCRAAFVEPSEGFATAFELQWKES